MNMVEIIYGAVDVDLFDGPGVGHRTYRADGHWLTGVESLDSATFCDRECAVAALEADGYTESDDDPSTWWKRYEDGAYKDAEMWRDPEMIKEMAPYSCGKCDAMIWDGSDN